MQLPLTTTQYNHSVLAGNSRTDRLLPDLNKFNESEGSFSDNSQEGDKQILIGDTDTFELVKKLQDPNKPRFTKKQQMMMAPTKTL